MKKAPVILSLALAIPVGLFLLQHYFYHSSGLQPTGFTVDENVLYMSYAHQYLDQPHAELFYSNPFDGNPSSPAIYFQPVTIFFAALMKAGADPGLTLSLFGLLMTIACIYTGILLLQTIAGREKNLGWLSLLFTWGGGLTAAAGIATWLFLPDHTWYSGLNAIYTADPANGWWGLNWGRNLFIPLEAYYHFLFLLNVYFVVKQRWVAAAAAAFFLSISHPFTGIEYLLIINGWLFIEKLLLKNKNIPYSFWISILWITAFHLLYYLVYLNQFPEHRKLFEQYSASWTYSLWVAVPAYSLVLLLSVIAAKLNKKFPLLSAPQQRLFLCWALISFLLSKHEWFIPARQPLHFTRGYTWAGLFLLALPVLVFLFNRWKYRYRTIVLAALITALLSDNILWTINLLRKKEQTEWEGHLTNPTREVLHFLAGNCTPADLLTGNARLVNYMANVYSPANAWVSHPYNTPDIPLRKSIQDRFLATGELPIEWERRRVLLIIDKNENFPEVHSAILGKRILFENSRYRIITP